MIEVYSTDFLPVEGRTWDLVDLLESFGWATLEFYGISYSLGTDGLLIKR